MSEDLPSIAGDTPWSVAHVSFAAGTYVHPASGLLQVRLVRRGSSSARVDLGAAPHQVYTRPGDLLVSLPDRATRFAIDERRDLTVLQWQRSDALRFLRSLGATGFDDLLPLLSGPWRDPLTASLIRRLQRSIDATAPPVEWTLGLVMHGLLSAARALENRTPGPTLSATRLEALLRRIDERVDETWSVARLADEAGMPRRAFAAAFKQATGLPVHQFVMRRRAERAIALLRGTSGSLAEIALASGFAHQAHLARVLKSLKGRTPSEIRAMPARGASESD